MKLKLTLIVLFISILSIQAQRKSDLINEINALKIQLDTTNTALATAKKNEKINLAKATSYEEQVSDLQNANTTLLKNLNNFAQVSNKNSENITKALESLEEKEAQLKIMNDAISKHDSTAVVVLANAKQTLGEEAKINVSNGVVIISKDLTSLFEEDGNSKLMEASKTWIEKIGRILSANPQVNCTIEGLSMTGDLNVSINQSKAIASSLINEFAIGAERISTNAKDGGFKESIQVHIHPNYESFYTNVRQGLKNTQK